MNQHSSRKGKYSSPLIGAALVAASLFQFSFPVFAAGTAPDTKLRNTATGTYQDDADTPNTYTIESNTVEVTVGKVAGITNINSGFKYDNTAASGNTELSTGDRAYFEFTITNVGNDVTNIYIPDLASIIPNTKGLDTNTTTGSDADKLIIQVSGPLASGASPNFTDIVTGGTTTIPSGQERPTTGTNGGVVENVAVNQKVVVRITGTVLATAANAPIEVLLGDTGSNLDPNGPVADTQNQPDTSDYAAGTPPTAVPAEQNQDVRTETATNTPGEDPIGGQKEASALIQQLLGSNPLAMARIKKTRTGYEDNGGDNTNDTPEDLSDDIISYSLDLEVSGSTPNAFFTPAALKGRDYTPAPAGDPANPNSATFVQANGNQFSDAEKSDLILISDAIPDNTDLAAQIGLPAAPGTAVNGWKPVYTEATTGRPDEMAWTINPPADLKDVTRVGWIYDARPISDGGSGPIPLNTTEDGATHGFTFNVVTNDLNTTGGTIANIAQVFGGTVGGDNIFDESGDQDPSNFNQDGNIGPTETDPLSTGIADPATHGVDTRNNNNLTGENDPNPSPGGEDNVFTINDVNLTGLLIGPAGEPAATGNVFGVDPDDTDHDFQNSGISNYNNGPILDSSGDPVGTVKHNAGHTINPDPVIFNNTLTNTSGGVLNDVLIQPVSPQFDGAAFNNNGVEDDVIPLGTIVKISRGNQTSVYEYIVDTLTTPTVARPNPRRFDFTGFEQGSAVTVPPLNNNDSLDYTVTVDLPAGTQISTDDLVNRGFPIPIVAFRDDNDSGTPNNGEDLNLTINQVYTGFVKISKQVRVLEPDGVTVRGGMDFANDDADKIPGPGDILEYRVIYRNISEPQVGSTTNGILNGTNILINENGTLDKFDDSVLNGSGNNWALDNNTTDGEDDIDTIHVQGSANDTSPDSTINYYSGEGANLDGMPSSGTTDTGADVTGYRSIIPSLAPAGAEPPTDFNEPGAGDFTFTFRRKVDEFDGVAPTYSEE